jgi:Fe-S oxidoreductase
MTAVAPEAGPAAALLRLVEEASGQNVYACYQCGKCTATCPFSLQPQRVMRLLQLGQIEDALGHDTTWDCAACLTCATDCPKDVSPALVQRALRLLHLHAERQLPELVAGNGHPPLDQHYREHAHPLRSQLFANIERLSRLGSALAPVSNWMTRIPGAHLANHWLLGIHRERALPPFVRQTFPAWFRRHAPLGDGHRGTVVLFHDTFMNYNYPSTGVAGTELLELAGFSVELADKVCCGRPMISKGLMDQAAAQARTNVQRLYQQAQRHPDARIVGFEPSCLLTLREEYLDLVPQDLKPRAREVASRAVLIDEFLGGLHADGGLELTFREAPEGLGEVLFHGHCHQKHSADPLMSVELLNLAGYRAEMADAGCCGMAGAYGFEKEHYAASREAGERALFPAVRAHPDAQIAVMGVSCRQQIPHFTGRPARHMVELLREAVR